MKKCNTDYGYLLKYLIDINKYSDNDNKELNYISKLITKV